LVAVEKKKAYSYLERVRKGITGIKSRNKVESHQRMRRIDELTDLKAIAIVLLFFVHSNLQLSMHEITAEWIVPWFLSVLFFVSGYLAFNSFNGRKQNIRDFLVHRLLSVYLPFVLIMGFYVLADNINYYSPSGFLSHASFLSLLDFFSIGTFDMRQFWFIPELLGFTVLLAILEKHVKNDLAQYLTLAALFIFNFISYAWTPRFLNWNFGFYIFVFAVGFTTCKRNWLQKLRDMRIFLASLLILILISLISYFIPLSAFNLSTVLGRSQYFSFIWIRSTAFSLSSIITLLTPLFYFRSILPGRILAIPEFLGSHTLYIYLWEGYINPRICGLVFGESFYYNLSGTLLFASILVRIIAVSAVAYCCQLLHKRIGHALSSSKPRIIIRTPSIFRSLVNRTHFAS
jgi:hypothetical protein